MNPGILTEIVRSSGADAAGGGDGGGSGGLGAGKARRYGSCSRPPARSAGTVGGAGLEEKVKGLLENVLQGREHPGLHRFELARQKPGALDSICGGSVTVFMEF